MSTYAIICVYIPYLCTDIMLPPPTFPYSFKYLWSHWDKRNFFNWIASFIIAMVLRTFCVKMVYLCIACYKEGWLNIPVVGWLAFLHSVFHPKINLELIAACCRKIHQLQVAKICTTPYSLNFFLSLTIIITH